MTTLSDIDLAIKASQVRKPLEEAPAVKIGLIVTALGFVALMVFLPLLIVFIEALREGVDVYLQAIIEPDAQAAIKLTLMTAAIAVPLNLIFGLSASWAIAKHDFRGKHLLITFIDLPFPQSPDYRGHDYARGE